MGGTSGIREEQKRCIKRFGGEPWKKNNSSNTYYEMER